METTHTVQEPSKPAVAEAAAPLDTAHMDEKPQNGKAASLSASSTRRDGDITDNEKANSVGDSALKEPLPADKEPAVESTEPPEHEWIEGPRLVMVMTGVTLACFLMFLDTSIIVTAVPQITNDFHSLSDVGWYGSAYQLASAALQPLTGKVYTHFSSKWSFLFFFLIFELGSLVCGVAPSSVVFIIGRAIAGCGVSGLMNGGLTIVAGSVPLEKRPQLTGILIGLSQFGLISGPLVGGAFTEYSTWRWCFYVNLPIGGAVILFLLLPHVPEQTVKQPWRKVLPKLYTLFDLPGFALIASASIMLLLALQYGSGNTYAWNSSVVIGLFVGGGATFIVWFIWNYRLGDEALIPFSMMRNTVVWTASVSSAFLFGTVFCASFFLPIYFQAVLGTTPFISGVNLLPSILPTMVAAVTSGIAVTKLGYYIPWALASGVITTIGFGLFSMLGPDTSTATWAGFQVLVGAGRGMGIQQSMIAVQSVLPPSQISVALSLLVFTQYLLGAVFLTLSNTIFDTSLRSQLSAIPSINADRVIAAGATLFRQGLGLSAEQISEVAAGYAKSVDNVFYFGVGLGFVMFVTSFGLGWNDIRKKTPKVEPTPAVGSVTGEILAEDGVRGEAEAETMR